MDKTPICPESNLPEARGKLKKSPTLKIDIQLKFLPRDTARTNENLN
jgi:hypothetical protein